MNPCNLGMGPLLGLQESRGSRVWVEVYNLGCFPGWPGLGEVIEDPFPGGGTGSGFRTHTQVSLLSFSLTLGILEGACPAGPGNKGGSQVSKARTSFSLSVQLPSFRVLCTPPPLSAAWARVCLCLGPLPRRKCGWGELMGPHGAPRGTWWVLDLWPWFLLLPGPPHCRRL